jgi:hypothetical protein
MPGPESTAARARVRTLAAGTRQDDARLAAGASAPASGGQANALMARRTLRGTEEIAIKGWRRLEDCDCPHCAAGGRADSLTGSFAEHDRERDASVW